jgi:hypothetical protein
MKRRQWDLIVSLACAWVLWRELDIRPGSLLRIHEWSIEWANATFDECQKRQGI